MVKRQIRQALAFAATPALLLSMSATFASAAEPNADEGSTALTAEINQLYASEPGALGRTHKMQAFIMELALHAKARNPDFKVIPQDAAELAFVDGDVNKGVLGSLTSLVDGWGKESLLLGGDGITPSNAQRPYVELANHGLMVTETSTVKTAAQLQDYYARAARWGIIPYPRVGGALAQELFPGKRWATNGDYFWVEDPATIGLGDRIDGARNVDSLTDARNYLYNINSRPYDAWETWDAEEAGYEEGDGDRTRITDSYGDGLLVPSEGGQYRPVGDAAVVQNAITLYGDQWDWWWRDAGLAEDAGRETWLNALRNSEYDVIYIDSFYNHRAMPSNQTPLTSAEIESLKQKPGGGTRQVIAYLSVGSAEQNRWYAQDDWVWTDPTNPNTERSMKSGKLVAGVYSPPEDAPAWLALGYGGNYAEEAVVQWWNPEWRDIIINGGSPYANVATGDNTSSIDRIIAQGFDGVYLDNVGVYNRTSGGGWNSFETYWLANGGIPGEDVPYNSDHGQTLRVQIPEVPSGPGEFTWSVDGTNGIVDLGTAVSAGDHYTASGVINPVRVTDTRLESPEWSVSAQVSDFRADGKVFEAKYLGWTPNVTENTGGAIAGAAVSSGFVAGDGLSVPSTLGSAPDGHEKGSALLGADLDLQVPISVGEGTYRATLVLTALS